MKRLSQAILFSVLALGLACGGDDGGGVDEAPPLDPNGTPTNFVVASIDVPTSGSEADATGLDIDGDGNVDNQLGDIFATVGSLSPAIDLQGSVDTSVANGASIVLVTVQATSLSASTGAGLFFYLGDNPSNPPCSGPDDTICGGHLDGATSFDIAANSPTDALVTGNIAGGRFTGGPGSITLEVTVAEGTDPLRLNLIGARADVRVSESGLM
ncbi:MAG: hypothetical protein KJO07_16905, partial [Deltaproteobacteria bacterium]|nr:hypothetical protein [Deltaproteobacteria bacterium]